MAEITAALVKQLREMTDSPMMECKKALVEAEGDIDKAVDVLRTRGIAKSVKKAGRETNEGAVAAFVSEDGTLAALAEVKCETDFVSGTDKFKTLAAKVAKAAAEGDPADLEALKAVVVDGETVEATIQNGIATMGENMTLTRFARRSAAGGAMSSYIHMGGKIGVLVEINCETDFVAKTDAFKALAHDIAMHIAAAKPTYVRREEVDSSELDHEREVLRAQALAEPKPKPLPIIEKMVEGRIDKYYKEVCLLEQPFVKDPDKSVEQLINEQIAKIGEKITVRRFARYEMGEGLQKRTDNFAEEVMGQMQK